MAAKKHSKKAVKRKSIVKSNVVWRQSAKEATLASKPHYNGFACGHGAHGPTKYDRSKAKREWKHQLQQEGASRGSFDFCSVITCGCQGLRFHFCEGGAQ